MSTGRKQGFFESDDDYRERMHREANQGRIERTTGDAPTQGFIESDDRYEERISREADEATIESVTGSSPSQGFIESDERYTDRIEQEANERTIEDVTDSDPSQGIFESDESYRDRVEREADEATIEQATGERPTQGFFESDEAYEERISEEADEHDSDDSSSSSNGGCFLTTACMEAAGLPDTCHELTVLRRFRDCYLAQHPQGTAMIAHYYVAAPRIVERIQHSPEGAAVFQTIFSDVRRVVSLIESGKPELALAVYAAMFAHLESQFSGIPSRTE